MIIGYLLGVATCVVVHQLRLWLGRRRLKAIQRSNKYGIFQVL